MRCLIPSARRLVGCVDMALPPEFLLHLRDQAPEMVTTWAYEGGSTICQWIGRRVDLSGPLDAEATSSSAGQAW
jgi:hypothetical protein